MSISLCNAQNVGISETLITPHSSAMLELRSNEKGFLITRLSTIQRDAIQNPAEALMIFNTTTKCLEIFVQTWYPIWCYEDTIGCGAPFLYNNHHYATVQLGNQCWFAEHLRTTSYNNGTAIPLKEANSEWDNTSPAYCWINNNQSANEMHGALYNWYAIDSGSNGGNNICPDGWFVPEENDWDILRTFLSTNGYNCIPSGGGGNIFWFTKSLSSATGWTVSSNECTPGFNQSSNNSSGFNAFPAGNRAGNGNFANYSTTAAFWSRTESSATNAMGRGILSATTLWTNFNSTKKEGRSVRCLKYL